MNQLLKPASVDDLLILLRAWRLWLAGAVLGGLLGIGAFAVFPPPFRAQASVLVDFNIEQSWPWPSTPDREVFYFLDREARKLKELAWSDAVLNQVAEENKISVSDLRNGGLILSQPADGAWHFYADSAQALAAEQIASSWAKAFTEQAQMVLAEQHDFEAHIQVTPTQIQNLPVNRAVSQGTYALAGAGLGMILMAFWVLFTKH